MRIRALLMAGAGVLMLGAGAALAQPKIYAYPSKDNYCPAGLQPVTIAGTICCGTPNQSQSYQSMMAHPVKKKRHVVRAKAVDCPIGAKGCSYN